jgi:hypothetical protein
MPLYLDKRVVKELNKKRKEIYSIRNEIYTKYKIDSLDTDVLSSLSLFEIVSKYDKNFNINFARNGEDAMSSNTPIELKTSRVSGRYTKTGKLRKHADRDAMFQFHAMGDLEHQRYIFAAKHKDDLSILRLYDISDSNNCSLVINRLLDKKAAWLERVNGNLKKMKHDLILMEESYIIDNISFCNKFVIGDCKVFTDSELYYDGSIVGRKVSSKNYC